MKRLKRLAALLAGLLTLSTAAAAADSVELTYDPATKAIHVTGTDPEGWGQATDAMITVLAPDYTSTGGTYRNIQFFDTEKVTEGNLAFTVPFEENEPYGIYTYRIGLLNAQGGKVGKDFNVTGYYPWVKEGVALTELSCAKADGGQVTATAKFDSDVSGLSLMVGLYAEGQLVAVNLSDSYLSDSKTITAQVSGAELSPDTIKVFLWESGKLSPVTASLEKAY